MIGRSLSPSCEDKISREDTLHETTMMFVPGCGFVQLASPVTVLPRPEILILVILFNFLHGLRVFEVARNISI